MPASGLTAPSTAGSHGCGRLARRRLAAVLRRDRPTDGTALCRFSDTHDDRRRRLRHVGVPGRLIDGTAFDTSRASVVEETRLAEAQPDREYAPLIVEVGTEQVIEGAEDGLVGLEAGETTTLTIPPEKAYGERTDENV